MLDGAVRGNDSRLRSTSSSYRHRGMATAGADCPAPVGGRIPAALNRNSVSVSGCPIRPVSSPD
ncbi:hypothetical protein BDP55DRAFT_664396 [Colletotrichum godetiae]|uniref:Uncharacterized protein n=1 Tax=Colletotrichum godetiae TaxID=1209918 RepID=A0AAJ0AN65_9PEZI|nr:uncharacterized protein BDP55DRAFT_664396 [Colletotrichum godetiae]KAK1675508.1 hypothetical protein BDP55DRAFT_664396 [Colletotrichum godetiae]